MSLDYFPTIYAMNKGRRVEGPKLDDYMAHNVYDKINACNPKDFWKRLDLYKQNLLDSPPKYVDYDLTDEHYSDGRIFFFCNSAASFFAHATILL